MKISFSLVTFLSLASGAMAFAPAPAITRSATQLYAINGEDPALQAAIADVRAVAAEFSDETVHFANVWIDQVLAGKQEGLAAGLLEECVLDDSDKCQRYSEALQKLDNILGVGMQEQF